ncbi:hypothetical protein [Planococcus beigongshangi]|uniref:hypothetical protein n=1 Tax=Planococcus beigongshangi TaxID=2782536 RepID=UPI00193C0EF2|nr:hypothetical protein [Planococcus beigongshangi]
MATKLKNDIWSLIAIGIALFSLLYCLSFFADVVFKSPAADLLASLRSMSRGDL